MSRRAARKHIFNLVFQIEFHNGDEIPEISEHYLEALESVSDADKSFIRGEIEGILLNSDAIDAEINKHASGWDLKRLAKADVAILRIAVYELMFAREIPSKVSVNEAVELAKQFSSDEAPVFINGILRSAMENLRGQEE